MKIIAAFSVNAIRVLVIALCISTGFLISSCAFGDKDAFEELFTGDGSEETLYVIVGTDVGGNDGIYVSGDAFLWSMDLCTGGGWGLNAVAYGNGRFVTSGSAGGSPDWYFSYDDVLWPSGGSTGGTTVWDIIFANNAFVAVGTDGNGAVHLSEDGLFWTGNIASYIVDTLYGISYGNGRFVAVGDNYHAYLSTDGLIWAGPFNNSGLYLANAIAYGNGRFVAVGNVGSVSVSENGLVWTTPQTTLASDFQDIAFGNGVFVAVGTSNFNNAIMYSTDGYGWIPVYWPSNIVNGVTFCKGRFIAVGDAGKIYSSISGKGWMENSGSIIGFPTLTDVTCRP